MTRVPIYLVETEVGPGLPTERTYTHEHDTDGKVIGHIVLPDGMVVVPFTRTLQFRFGFSGNEPGDIIQLPPHRAVQAAVTGEHGLAWEAAP